MNNCFSILFKVVITHSYFKDGVCNCVRFSAGPMTMRLMKWSKFKFAVSNNLIAFGGPSSYKNRFDHLKKTTGIDYFDIELTSTDDDFNHFTKMPMDHAGGFIYDTQNSDNFFVKGSLHLRGKKEKNDGNGRLGIIKVHFDDIESYGSQNRPASFIIDFESRATQWQYFIISTNGSEMQNLSIKKGEISFTGPEKVIMKNGQEALFFSSANQLLTLKEFPEHRFSLSSGAGDVHSTSKTIIKSLPCPRPSHFDFVEVNGVKEMASPMYVFI